MPETAAEAMARVTAPLLAKLQDTAGDLIPVRPVEGDRVYEHPSGWVSVKVRPGSANWFEDMAALRSYIEEIEREIAPGRIASVTDLHGSRLLTEEPF